MLYRSQYFIAKRRDIERNTIDRDSSDWQALDRFTEVIKKALSKKVTKATEQRIHGVTTPSTTTPRTTIESPAASRLAIGITSTLTPAPASALQQQNKRSLPTTIEEIEEQDVEELDTSKQLQQQTSSRKRGRLELHSDNDEEQQEQSSKVQRRTSGRIRKSQNSSLAEQDNENIDEE